MTIDGVQGSEGGSLRPFMASELRKVVSTLQASLPRGCAWLGWVSSADATQPASAWPGACCVCCGPRCAACCVAEVGLGSAPGVAEPGSSRRFRAPLTPASPRPAQRAWMADRAVSCASRAAAAAPVERQARQARVSTLPRAARHSTSSCRSAEGSCVSQRLP